MRACRELAEELTGAVVQMYGAGLERIVELIRRGGPGPARRRRAGRRPPHDPRPVSGADRGAGARRRSRRCGRTWSRTAATSSCWGSRTGSPGCASRAAASRAGRRRRRSSWRCGRRSRRRRRICWGWTWRGSWRRRRSPGSRFRCPMARPPGTRSSIEAPELLSTTDVAGMSLFVANVDGTLLAYRNACASCGGALGRSRARRRRARMPELRPQVLPAPGRPLDGRRPPAAPAVPLLREAEEIKVAL